MDAEIWKDVPGYEGLYQASTLGNIRSLDRWSKEFINNGTPCRKKIKGKLLKGSVDEDGYLDVDLYDGINIKPKSCRINRIIALTFVPNPDNLPQVDHLNGIKDDNRACNLEWVSCQENIQRAWRDGRCSPPVSTPQHIERIRAVGRRSAEWTGKPCRCIEDNLVFNTLAAAANHYGVHPTTIKEWIVKGQASPAYNNRHFEFIDNKGE